MDLNNQWREAQLAEQEEIHRILAAITGLVAAAGGLIVRTVDALGGPRPDLWPRRVTANAIRGIEPELVAASRWLPGRPAGAADAKTTEETSSDGADTSQPSRHAPCAFIQARHPLLDPLTVVPVDIYLDDDYFILVITGPNTGGKTVSLKTTGLLTLMAQAGLAIPADEGSTLSVFEQVFADIGDEQSIEQSLSTFSSHMTHIVDILARGRRAVRWCCSTSSAPAPTPRRARRWRRRFSGRCSTRSITTLATTHYSELKVFAHTTPFVANAASSSTSRRSARPIT